MARQEVINEFIDKLFEDCEDALIDGDVPVILDYFEKYYREVGTDFEVVFLKVITSIIDKSDLEKYKQEFGYFLYLYLANFFGVEDVYIPDFKPLYLWRFNSRQWKSWGHEKPFSFKKVTIEYSTSRPSFSSDELLECDELIIDGNNTKGDYLDVSWKANTITFNTYVKKVDINSCNNIIFDKNSVIYVDKIPVLMPDFSTGNPANVKTVILPEVDGVQVPRWMCSKLNKDITIYKQVGQKISIFSIYKDWLKEHVKSV